jgi:glutaredoxin
MRTTLLIALVTLGLFGCEGSLGFAAHGGGGGGGPVLLGAPDAPRPDAATYGASDAGVTYSADAYVPQTDAYVAPSCTPMCTGRSCGSDGCGGTCGSCATGSTCNASGMCAPNAPPAGQVVLYGTSSCGYCRQARAYFTSRGVPFRDVSLSAPGAFEEAIAAAAAYGIPEFAGGPMPFIEWGGPRVPANFTNGWSESIARAHGL